MTKTKTKIKIYTIADYKQEEKWLEDEQKKGWKLIKIKFPFFYVFEESIPEKIVYQLEYKNEAITEDYIQLYADYGWEYLDSLYGWNYFRKLENSAVLENDSKIFSDAESKVNMINKIFKTRMLPILVIFLGIVVPVLFSSLNTFSNNILAYMSKFLISALFLWYLYVIIHCSIKLKKLKKEV